MSPALIVGMTPNPAIMMPGRSIPIATSVHAAPVRSPVEPLFSPPLLHFMMRRAAAMTGRATPSTAIPFITARALSITR